MKAEARPTKADRTRRDIVTAAVEVWSSDNAAPLSEIAEGGGGGRTTVNRYFTDRRRLITAVDEECKRRYAAAVARSRPEEGTGLQALLRLCGELLQLGPVLGMIFADNALVDPDTWYADEEDPLGQVVARGCADGSLAADLPGDWVGTVVWTSLFAAQLLVRSGARTWHEAADLLSRTLRSGIAGRS